MTMMVPDFQRFPKIPEDWHVKAWWLTSLTSLTSWSIFKQTRLHTVDANICNFLNCAVKNAETDAQVIAKAQQNHTKKASNLLSHLGSKFQHDFFRLIESNFWTVIQTPKVPGPTLGLDALLKSGSLRDCLQGRKKTTSQRFVWLPYDLEDFGGSKTLPPIGREIQIIPSSLAIASAFAPPISTRLVELF